MKNKILSVFIGFFCLILIAWGVIFLNTGYHFERGKKFESQNNLDLAQKEYRKAAFLNPDPALSLRQGIIFYSLGFFSKNEEIKNLYFKEASNCVEKSIKLNPKESDNYQLRGRIYFAQKNLEKAEKDFETALKLNPLGRLDYYFDLSNLYLKKNELEEADELLSKISQEYTKEVISYFLGEKKAHGFKFYDQIVELYFLRGVVNQKMDNLSRAQDFFKIAEDLKDQIGRENTD